MPSIGKDTPAVAAMHSTTDMARPAFRERLLREGLLMADGVRGLYGRSREFEAYHSGAHLIHDGEPLARALEKIDAAARRTPMNVDPAHATAYIINPLTGRKIRFANLFTTHPPTADCIARLRNHQHA